jgi:hypothetical protein
MGTECTLHLYAPTVEIADDAATAVIDEVERIEAKYSKYLPDSALSRVNAAARAGGFVDDETAVLLDYAFAVHPTSLIGEAPKNFVSVHVPGRSKRDKPDTWPQFIAKVGHKRYLTESITEHLLTRVGERGGLANRVRLRGGGKWNGAG